MMHMYMHPTSMSGCCGNGCVMQSHLMEVVWVKPWWCLVKHLCSYVFAQYFVTLQVTWWSHDSHVINLPAHVMAGHGHILCLIVLEIYLELSNLYRNWISSHVMSPNVHLTCSSKSLLAHLWANISSMNHSCVIITKIIICVCFPFQEENVIIFNIGSR